MAENLGVRNLVLYHTEDDTIADRKNLYTREGKAYYHGKLFVPDDLEIINL
jgi:ribonuclease Z